VVVKKKRKLMRTWKTKPESVVNEEATGYLDQERTNVEYSNHHHVHHHVPKHDVFHVGYLSVTMFWVEMGNEMELTEVRLGFLFLRVPFVLEKIELRSYPQRNWVLLYVVDEQDQSQKKDEKWIEKGKKFDLERKVWNVADGKIIHVEWEGGSFWMKIKVVIEIFLCLEQYIEVLKVGHPMFLILG